MTKKYLNFIDFETTGSDIFNDYPLHFGAVLVTVPDFKILNQFESYIKPEENIKSSKIAFDIHGITNDKVVTASPLKKVLYEFFQIFGTGYSFAGWNVCFDISFFRRGCFESNYYDEYLKIDYRHLDIQTIAQALFYANRLPGFDGSMDSLCSILNLSRDLKHSGFQDAFLSMQIYKKLLNMIKNN